MHSGQNANAGLSGRFPSSSLARQDAITSSAHAVSLIMDSFLFHAFIYLVAAVISVPLAKRFGLGSVLGYLLAGTLIGPHVLNLVGEQADHVMHFAEFGVRSEE